MTRETTVAPAGARQRIAEQFARLYAPLAVVLGLVASFDLYADPDPDPHTGQHIASMWAAAGTELDVGSFWTTVLVVLLVALLIGALAPAPGLVVPLGIAVLGAVLLALVVSWPSTAHPAQLADGGKAAVACTVMIVVSAVAHLVQGLRVPAARAAAVER